MSFVLKNINTEPGRLVARWLEQYGDRDPESTAILQALPPNPTADQVDMAFAGMPYGSSNRVQRVYTCDECRAEVPAVVLIDTDPEDWHSTELCLHCVLKLVKMVQ